MATSEAGPGSRRAVFLDRDGTINEERSYLYRVEDFAFLPGVPEAIRRLNEAGYLVVVVTNQSGIARGFYGVDDVETLHAHIRQQLARQKATIDAFYLCPHHPTEGEGAYLKNCDCRKGEPGMLLQAAADLGIDLAASYMVGDKLADIEAAERACCKPILVLTGYGAETCATLASGRADVCGDLAAAVELILKS